MNPIRKVLISASLVGCTLAGGAIGATLVGTAQAADDTTSTTAPAAPAAGALAPGAPGNPNGVPPRGGAQFDPSRGGHVGPNGVKEELLTGDTAEKVKAAALAAVPGGTIQRVENDAEGSPYEAHMTKADGSQVTVKVDGNFNSTSVEDGPR